MKDYIVENSLDRYAEKLKKKMMPVPNDLEAEFSSFSRG